MLAPRRMDICTECSNWRGLFCSISAASLFSGSSGLGSCTAAAHGVLVPGQLTTYMLL